MQGDFLNPQEVWSIWGAQMGVPGRETHSDLSHFAPGGPCDLCHLSPGVFPLGLLWHSAVPVAQVRSVWGPAGTNQPCRVAGSLLWQ